MHDEVLLAKVHSWPDQVCLRLSACSQGLHQYFSHPRSAFAETNDGGGMEKVAATSPYMAPTFVKRVTPKWLDVGLWK